MTVIKNVTFPNADITAFEEDASLYDTEVVESMSGVQFRNAKRSAGRKTWKLSYWCKPGSTTPATAISVKNTVKGRAFGFKWTNPRDSVTYDVAFRKDDWTVKVVAGNNVSQSLITFDVELEQVLDGVPE